MTIDRATQAVEYAADILARHHFYYITHEHEACACGWRGESHARHQAQRLRDAGLLADTTVKETQD